MQKTGEQNWSMSTGVSDQVKSTYRLTNRRQAMCALMREVRGRNRPYIFALFHVSVRRSE